MSEGELAGAAAEATEATGPDASPEALRAEIAALRERLAKAEAAAARSKQSEEELRQSQELLQAIIDNSAAVIFVKDKDGRHLLINRRYETLFHLTRAWAQGKTDYEIFPAEIAEKLRSHDKKVLESRTPVEVEEIVPQDDGPHTYISVKFPVYGPGGAVIGVCGIATDISERRRAEEAQAELQRRIIEAQKVSLRELSTPLIPLSEGVVAMPLIGAIDSARAAQIMETLLGGITARRARVAILDVTGIKVVDAGAAEALTRVARAAGLLGAEVILTGISAPVAMSLVELHVDLSRVRILDTLQTGIAYALRH